MVGKGFAEGVYVGQNEDDGQHAEAEAAGADGREGLDQVESEGNDGPGAGEFADAPSGEGEQSCVDQGESAPKGESSRSIYGIAEAMP